ncbi:MAG: hypothetical protein PUF82_00305 [Lactobacillus equicursoris]|uniref:hypothetical protein n=1 Tax=Lactobacillus equicursoris TaxID=420645 RepID=UPI00242F7787|nr:hypothetical protein [Lactobacillus equicursoris]MDD6406445.1 hypothetical protein [Lactobacillus equicursoris]
MAALLLASAAVLAAAWASVKLAAALPASAAVWALVVTSALTGWLAVIYASDKNICLF